jgi:hypothetical protein
MIGKLVKEENKWFVKYFEDWIGVKYVELHPDDVKQIEEDSYHFDNIEARIASYPDVEFKLIENPNRIYAKLIPIQPVDEHGYPIYGTFGRDRVNKTIEEDAERLYPINNTGDMFMPNREQINNSYRQEGFIEGAKSDAAREYWYNEFRKSHYSEEEVLKAINISREFYKTTENDGYDAFKYTSFEIIEQFKKK